MTIKPLFTIFLLSHLPILFNKSIGWDGYFLLNGNYENLRTDFMTYGLFLMPEIHYFFIKLTPNPVLTYNIAVFFCSLLSTFLSFEILRKIKLFSNNEAIYIAAIISVLPYIFINLIGFTAILFYVFFLIGVYCLILFLERKIIIWRILSIGFFFLSFFYNSHVSYYLIALLLLWYLFPKPFNTKKFIIRYLDFILLPIFFVIIYKGLFALQEGPKDLSYNAVNVLAILRVPKYLAYSFVYSFFQLFQIVFTLLSTMFYFILILITFLAIYRIFNKITKSVNKQRIRIGKTYIGRPLFILLLGIFLFFLGALPFSLASKPPAFYNSGAADIHQCNLYFGSAIAIYSLINILIKDSMQKIVFIGLIASFAVANFNNVLSQNKQWLKEESLIINFRSNEKIRNNHSFVIDDNTPELNSSYRLQFFTLNSLMKKALNEQTRFAITRDELKSLINDGHFKDTTIFDKSRIQFGMKDYRRGKFECNIKIEKGNKTLTDWQAIKLLFYSFIDKDKFENEVVHVVSLKVYTCSDCPNVIN